jgi:ubiquitin-conjugating enzyme E2 S
MGSNENVAPKVMNQVLKQLAGLQESKLDGIRYLQNDENPLDIQAELEGPDETPYAGGVFRLKLTLGSDFPAQPPKAYLLTKIFHPNIAPTGEVCVNTLKRDWQPTNWSIPNILQVIRCLLIVPFPESALNEEAGKLFMESYEEYADHARMMTQVHAQRHAPARLPAARPAEGLSPPSDPVAEKADSNAKRNEKPKSRKTLKRL